MKIIHTADLHLESKMESNLTKEQAQKRRSELLDTFERIIKYAGDCAAEVVMISGDMFDKSNVRKTAMRQVIDLFKSHPSITFLYLKGNHDCEAFEAELTIDTPENVRFFSSEKWTSYEFGDVVISGREINDKNQNSLGSDLVLDVAKCNIVMLHGQESLYDGPDKTHIINLKSLKNKYIDYLALGHIHSYKLERLDERGVYCYPGCPEPRGFDECGPKGFVVLDINDKQITTEFVCIQRRSFIEKEINITYDMDMTTVFNVVEKELENISSDSLLKLIITGQTELDRDIDTERIRDRFADRFYFLKVYDRTKARIDYESFTYDRSLKGSFVRLVMGLDISEDKKADIIETGIRAIMGEDITQ